MEAAWQYLHRRLSTQMKDLGGLESVKINLLEYNYLLPK